MSTGSPPAADPPLLVALGRALDAAPRPVREIEVGIALSIALGRQRPAVACGGCKTPLAFRGIPAVTNAQLKEPFRLRFDD
ncbi:MAG TPA: hypothetical protein VMH90_02020 [Thermoplasmata archaeon]|nr:hypothetical protein [Thermoplasmata archaeon]